MSAERVERRLAAILAADVAGYSRLMGQDEAGTLARLRSHRRELIDPTVAEHKGRIVKTTGDGILIEFPSVVEAVACAVAVQQGMAERNAATPEHQRIVFRVGVNLGDIIVEDGDIHGDGVNVAARLGGCGRTRRRLSLGHGPRPYRRQARPRLRRFRRAGAEKHRPPGPGLPRWTASRWPAKPPTLTLPRRRGREARVARGWGLSRAGAARQAVDRGVAVPEHERRPGAGVFRRRHRRGDHNRNRPLSLAIRDRPQFAFTYKGKAVDVRQVARELGVRYVLEGSVRKAGNRVRITGQLIDTASGAHIWADRFDGSLDDVFDLQDQVASHVVVAIEPRLRLIESDRASRKPTDNLNAYDLYLRAQAENYKRTKEGFAEAIRLARRALELDPAFALAMSRIAISRCVQMLMHSIPASGAEVEEGIHMARQALAVASDNPEVLRNAAVALAALAAGENATALAALDRAVELNPNYAIAYAQRSYLLAWLNRPDEAIAAAERAVHLSPNDPVAFEPHHALCLAQLAAGRYEEALSSADRALRRNAGFLVLRLKLSLLGHLSRREEARECLQRLRETVPDLTIAALIRSEHRGMSPELVGRIAEGLRKAVLPEE